MAHTSIITEEDFLHAYDEYSNGIFRHCYAWLNDKEKSLEIMTETFQRLWLFIAAGNYVDSMRIFLYREATNVVMEVQKTMTQTETPSPVESAWAALHELPLEDRHLYILHYVDDLSCTEISEIIGGSAFVYAKKLHKMHKKLSPVATHA